MTKFLRHIPPHAYLDEQLYFITSRTIEGLNFFDNKEKLIILKNRIDSAIKNFKLELFAWVLIANHYHLLFRLIEGEKLSEIIKFINGGSAFDLNKLENFKGRQIWWNYWDYCIRGEDDFYKHFNYIHSNPIKHGLVKNYQGLKNYEFSSYKDYYKKHGEQRLMEYFEYHPIVDFSVPE